MTVNNKQLGVSSVVLHHIAMLAEAVKCDVMITILPKDKLAHLEDLQARLLEHNGKAWSIEKLASSIHRDCKAFYADCKCEVIVETVEELAGWQSVRVHVAS